MKNPLLTRFLRYTSFHTTSDETTHTHPSTQGQRLLAESLAAEMREMGLENVRVTAGSYVFGELSATPGLEKVPPLGFIAHLDTSDAVPGDNIRPQVIEHYDGKPIPLGSSGLVLDPSVFPDLRNRTGETLVTTDGTTLLGGDDHAGIAVILTAAEKILREKIPHGKLCFGFTPDEEIGEGTMFFPVPEFGAWFAYTLDGGDISVIEYQNFNAASAEVAFHGVSSHPGSAKDVMKNASAIAMEFHAMLPADEVPEKTENFEGFFHLHAMEGNVVSAKLRYLVRDHDSRRFEERKSLLRNAEAAINARYGKDCAVLTVRDQYRNMESIIMEHPFLIRYAEEALKEQNIVPVIQPIRGGTDGAMLSFQGLPCPNLGAGAHNIHGLYEYVSLDEMDASAAMVLRIIRRFAEQKEELPLLK